MRLKSSGTLALRAGVLAAGVWLLMTISVQFTREAGQLSGLWLANALVLGVLLRRPRSEWPVLLGVALLTNSVISLQVLPLTAAFILPLGNCVEILICAVGLRHVFKDELDLSRPKHLMSFASFVLAGALGFSLSALASLAAIGKGGTAVDIVSSYAAHALGLLILTPAFLTIKASDIRALIDTRMLWRASWLTLVLIGVLLSVFTQTNYPFLFFVPGVLLLVTFNGSTTAASAALLVTGIVSIFATLTGHGPIALVHGSLREKLLVLQVFLWVMIASVLPVAAALADRRRLESQLRHALKDIGSSEARYRLLTENANDLVTEADQTGRFTYVSPSLTAMTGYGVDEVIGRKALSFVHPDDRDRVAAALANALSGPTGSQIEYRAICKDGGAIWVEARPTFVIDPKTGEPASVTDVIRDITDRRKATEALAGSEARYRLLADNSTDVILKFGPEGRNSIRISRLPAVRL